MIGLVLGETQLGSLIINKLNKLKIKYTIIDISKKNIYKKKKNSYSVSIGQLGKAIYILKKFKCKKIIFAGTVSRPNFANTKFDLKALYYLPRIIKSSKKGDSYIIKEVSKIFKKENLKIIKQTYFNPELVIKKGNHTRLKPSVVNKKDIIIGAKKIRELKIDNIGQAVVVLKGNIIAIEDQNGTDSMLNKTYKILKKYSKKNIREGILIKFPKSNQDLKIDLPTIGINTIRKCHKIGLKGIALKANQSIFLDKSKSIALSNKYKMFICAI